MLPMPVQHVQQWINDNLPRLPIFVNFQVSERSERALMKTRIRASERSELVTTSDRREYEPLLTPSHLLRSAQTEQYVYYQHTVTGQSQMDFPTPAFEKKIDSLARLTPRDHSNPDNGEFMWREEPEEERRRQRYEVSWRAKRASRS